MSGHGRNSLRVAGLAALLAALAVVPPASAQQQAQTGQQADDAAKKPPEAGAKAAPKDRVYGGQMMTPEERAEFHKRMRNAASAEEREKIRAEHHKAMQERAKERGLTLPDMPPQSPGHMGSGGMGPGQMGGGAMGPANMGSGGGRGPQSP